MPAMPSDRFPPKIPVSSASGTFPASQAALRRTELLRGELVRMRDDEMERSVIAPSAVDDQRVKWLNRKIKQAETVTSTGRHARDTVKTLQKLQQLQAIPAVPHVAVSNGHGGRLSNGHDGRLSNGHDGRLSNGHDGRFSNGPMPRGKQDPGASSRAPLRTEEATEGPRLKDATNTLRTTATHKNARARVMDASFISSTPKAERTRASRPTVSPIRDFSFEASTHDETSQSREPARTGASLAKETSRPAETSVRVKEEHNLSLMNVSSASQVIYMEERPDIDIHDVSLDSVGDIIHEEEDPVDIVDAAEMTVAPQSSKSVSVVVGIQERVPVAERDVARVVQDVADAEQVVGDIVEQVVEAERHVDMADTVLDAADAIPVPRTTPEPSIPAGADPTAAPVRLVVEGTTRSPGGSIYTKRFTATFSAVDGQLEDVLIYWNDLLRLRRAAGVLDIREELLPFSADNAPSVRTEENTTKSADDVSMEAVFVPATDAEQVVRIDNQDATASSSAQGSAVPAADDRVPSTSAMEVDERPDQRNESRDEFHKYLDALMNENATADELEQLELDFEALCAHDAPAERVDVQEEVETDEELSSGEDEAFDLSVITKAVEEVMGAVVDGLESVAQEGGSLNIQQTEQPKKRNKDTSFGIDLADILAQAGDIELDGSDSDDSFQEMGAQRNAQGSFDDLSDDDSTDMEIDSGVEDFIDGVFQGMKEAEEARLAQDKAQRKQAKVAAGASDSETSESEASDEESVSDRSEPVGNTVVPSITEQPKKIYDITDDQLMADIAELLGEDPAAEDKDDQDSEDSGERRSSDRPRGSSGRKSGGRALKKPSKRDSEDEDSEVDFVVRKSPSKPASQSRSARRALESESEYEPSEDGAAEKEEVVEEHDVVVISSDDDSIADMPNFNPKPVVLKAPLVTKSDKKKRKPVRAKKILEDKDLSRESKQALQREQNRKDRLEELRIYDGGILDEFVEEEIEFKVEVHPELWNKLEEHQKGGVKFMYRNVIESYEYSRTHPFGGCILAHSMGLGKTVQVISFLQAVLSNEALNLETCLVLCPASTVGNWENEVNHWMKGIPKGLTIKAYTLTEQKNAGDRLRLMERWKRDGGVLIMSYAMYTNLCKTPQFPRFLQEPGPDIVVCDEAHELKNSKSARTIAVSEISTNARIALTGTPMQNNLNEYFTMVNFIKPSLLGTRKEFDNRFAVPIKAGSLQDAGAVEKKTMQKRSHVLREYLSACLELKGVAILMERLPPKTEHVLRLRPTPAQEALYRAFIQQLQVDAGHTPNQMISCTKSVQLISFNPRCVQKDQENERRKAQKNYSKKHPKKPRNNDEEAESDPESDVEGAEGSAPFPAYFDGLLPASEQLDVTLGAKTAILREIIVQCVINDEKLLIFSDRRVVLSVVEELLEAIGKEGLVTNRGEPIEMQRGTNYLAMDGSVPQAKRPALIDKFNKHRQCHVFLLSIKAAGQGINLIGASRVVLLEPMWNPTVDRQALFRTYRYGQTKPVHVYRLVTAGICEERVFEVQVDKQSMFNRVLEEKHAKGAKEAGADFFAYIAHPFTAPFVPAAPPQDRIVRGILDKFPEAIVKTENFDSLLEPVEVPLTFEEQLVAWAEIEIEERNHKSDPLRLPFDRERAVAQMNKEKIAPFPLTVDDVASTKHFVVALTRKLWSTKEKRKQRSNGGNVFMKECRPVLEKATRIADQFRRQEQFEYTNHPAAPLDADNMPSTSRGPVPPVDNPPRPPGLINSAVRAMGTSLDAIMARLRADPAGSTVDERVARIPPQGLMDIARHHMRPGMAMPRPTVYRNIHPANPVHNARPLGVPQNVRPPGFPQGHPNGFPEMSRLLESPYSARPPGLPPAPARPLGAPQDRPPGLGWPRLPQNLPPAPTPRPPR